MLELQQTTLIDNLLQAGYTPVEHSVTEDAFKPRVSKHVHIIVHTLIVGLL